MHLEIVCSKENDFPKNFKRMREALWGMRQKENNNESVFFP